MRLQSCGSRCFFLPHFYTSDSKLCKEVHCVDPGESFQMSIYYVLANIGFDTAENEPCKICPIEPRFLGVAQMLCTSSEAGGIPCGIGCVRRSIPDGVGASLCFF